MKNRILRRIQAELTEMWKKYLDWKMKHTIEITSKAREYEDIKTYYELKEYVDDLEKRLLGIK